MQEKITSKIVAHPYATALSILGLILLINGLTGGFFFYLGLGIFSVVVIQLGAIWWYLGERANRLKKESIAIQFAKIEVQKISYHPIMLNPEEKKDFYEHSGADLFNFVEKNPSETHINLEDVNEGEEEELAPKGLVKQKAVSFSKEEVSKLLQETEKPAQPKKQRVSVNSVEDKIVLVRMGRKDFNTSIQQFITILNTINQAERSYGQILKDFSPVQKDLISNVEQAPKEKNPFNQLSFECLKATDLPFLEKRLGNLLIGKKVLNLPEWIHLKQALSTMGYIHLNFSSYISKVAISTIHMLRAEYNERYLELKKEKKLLSKEYEDAFRTYMQLKEEFDELQGDIELCTSDYHSSVKNRETDTIVHKLEAKTHRLSGDMDSLKNKLALARDKLARVKDHISRQNLKLRHFTKEWNQQRESVCKNMLHSMFGIFLEGLHDQKNTFESLITTYNEARPGRIDIAENLVSNKEENTLENMAPESTIVESHFLEAKVPSLGVLEEALPTETPSTNTYEIIQDESTIQAKLNLLLKRLKGEITDFYLVQIEQAGAESKAVVNDGDLVTSMLKSLIESEELNLKEKLKLVEEGEKTEDAQLNLGFWRATQVNLHKLNKESRAFLELLVQARDAFTQNFINYEKDMKNYIEVLENSVKRANSFVKSKEDLLQEVRVHELNEAELMGEIESIRNDFQIALNQLKLRTSNTQKDLAIVKKNLIIAYIRYSEEQIKILDNLLEKSQKLSMEKENTKVNFIVTGQVEPDNETTGVLNIDVEERIKKVKGDIVPPIYKDTQSYNNVEWLNKIVTVLTEEWSKSAYFKKQILKTLNKSANKNTPAFLKDGIQFKDFILQPRPPEIRSITPLPSEKLVFLYDIELSYYGDLFLEIHTAIDTSKIAAFLGERLIEINVKILLRALHGKMRICWVPTELGKSWIAFVGQPVLDLAIEPQIGSRSSLNITTLPQISGLITEFVSNRVKKMTYPYRTELDFPAAFAPEKVKITKSKA